MSNMIDYLSGNVPGGIGLYLFVMTVLFLVLFGISRRNDLFTPRHFKMWFAGISLVLTLFYAVIWMGNPPPAAFSRYGAFFYSENEQDKWLAYYFREAVSRRLEPGRSATDHQYLQRWNYLAGADCQTFSESHCENIAELLPLDELAIGKITRSDGNYRIEIALKTYPGGKLKNQKYISFSDAALQEAVPEILNWLQSYFPIRKAKLFQESPVAELAIAKDLFFRNDYQESRQLCEELLRRNPDHEEARKWFNYNEIRIAKAERALAEPETNPFNLKKAPWAIRAENARINLINMAKRNYETDVQDALLSNMLAESFILEELYGDAEQFLKIGFGENPYSIEILENLSLLHPSRLQGLPLRGEMDLLSRILNICPANEKILKTYIDKLLVNVQITDAQSNEIKKRLDKALALNPRSITALTLQGKFYNLIFDYDRALKSFAKADSLSPDDGMLQYNLGVTHFKMEQFDEAEMYFQQAVNKSDFLNAHLYLGVIYKNRGDYEKALEKFRYRVANKQGDDDYYALQAMKGIRECLTALNIPIPN